MLTPAQLTTLGAAIDANTAQIGGVAINALPRTPDTAVAVAAWYNLTASPAFVVWRDLPTDAVLDLITFASMTPADAVPTTPALTVDVWRARSLACQGKQFNLQTLLFRPVVRMKRTNIRAAIQDALTNIPAGAAGALVAANWVGVRDAAKFNCTSGERVFATGTGTTATPGDLGYEGEIFDADIRAVWGI